MAWRDVHGVLVLDKSSGLSSNGALQRVRRLLQARKAGHTGSLDPLATGVLPICLGEASKYSHFLLDADKVYLADAQLGEATDTGDRQGTVVAVSQVALPSRSDLNRACQSMVGHQLQVPPMYSALKQGGRRLYELAREGVTVERAPRPIRVISCDLLSVDEGGVRFRVRCSKGTYVRTLIEDMAKAAGTLGFMTELRREVSGPFDLRQAVTLDELQDFHARSQEGEGERGEDLVDWLKRSGKLLPVHAAVADLPPLMVDSSVADSLISGQTVKLLAHGGDALVRVYRDSDRCFVGVARTDGDRLLPFRMMSRGLIESEPDSVGRL